MNVPVPPPQIDVPFVSEPDKVKSPVAQIVPPRPASATGTSLTKLLIEIVTKSVESDPEHAPTTFPVVVNVKVTLPAVTSA